MKKKLNKKTIVYYVLSFFNRLAHWIDLVIYYFICNWLYNAQFSGSKLGWLVYLPLIFQIYLCIKYEWLVLKSKNVCNFALDNGRVMGFCGKQGAGKSSFATYLSSFKRFSKVYSNTPIKIRQKYTCVLEKDILNLDKKVPDKSLIMLDEATLFYHNLKSQDNRNLSNELYAQEICSQCIRHFTDGNMFYIGTNLNRLPSVIRENVGVTNFMLGQGSKCISLLTGFAVVMIAKCFGYSFYNGLRFWDVQQFEKIPQDGYIFDLSNQDKDTDLTKYANLVRVYTFNNPNLFDYNDRFLAGVYQELEEHTDKYWESLDYNHDLLKQIGYGEIIEFFDAKQFKAKRRVSGSPIGRGSNNGLSAGKSKSASIQT